MLHPYLQDNILICWNSTHLIPSRHACKRRCLLGILTNLLQDRIPNFHGRYKFSSFLNCVRHTYSTEGANGFWRGGFVLGLGIWPLFANVEPTGALAPLLSITLVRTVSFSIYQKAKYTYDDWIEKATGSSPLVHANTRGAMPSLSTITCFGAAGVTSGSVITALSCPFELTKLNAQIAVLMEKGMGKNNSFEAQ